jgi:hypothetical protein
MGVRTRVGVALLLASAVSGCDAGPRPGAGPLEGAWTLASGPGCANTRLKLQLLGSELVQKNNAQVTGRRTHLRHEMVGEDRVRLYFKNEQGQDGGWEFERVDETMLIPTAVSKDGDTFRPRRSDQVALEAALIRCDA